MQSVKFAKFRNTKGYETLMGVVLVANLTSMWHGNFFLTQLDLFSKHELKIHDYIRYCDNFWLGGNDKTVLHKCRRRIGAFLAETLGLEYSKANVFNVKQGIDCLGYSLHS